MNSEPDIAFEVVIEDDPWDEVTLTYMEAGINPELLFEEELDDEWDDITVRREVRT